MYLSGYRILWIQVIFDLPVLTKLQRKRAAGFRNALLDLGFEMVQFSVYQRFAADKFTADSYIDRISDLLPQEGKVHILVFTDKQFENIKTFNGYSRIKNKKNPAQLSLF